MTRRGILLDRDGTLNVRPAPHHYVTTTEGFRWLPGVPDALASLSRAGYVLGVASNQRGVARRVVHPDVLAAIERRIREDLLPLGVGIEAFRYCPHDLDANCTCRKPKPGLLHMLAEDLDIELKESWMVGDTAADVEAGRAAGCRTAVLGASAVYPKPDLHVASLAAFAQHLATARAGATDRRMRAAEST
jgi:D-glycero-D-manno-heptose 1,7-bisphosphate phosphatase